MFFKFDVLCLCFLTFFGAVDLFNNGDDIKSVSFFRFTGPVSGRAEQINVYNPQSGTSKVDYIAKPDYSYHYGVQDSKTGNFQGHQENRNGDSVNGEYRVMEANGLVRIVRYTADPEYGFKAFIEYVKLKNAE
ncbi:cuticle protein 18.6-like [Anthonomus grandis grandis]|uniref:cuticle protein 18.6-like n=1 Tax=Anthonomus grandis grandis TaxID=2921223 RepID=UPI002166193D|nr:cuticle protein 18.6-like [Anthonomus grandis grandis]